MPSSPLARPPTLFYRWQRHLHLFQIDPCRRSSPIWSRETLRVVPLYVHVHPLITSYPARLPRPQSSNYIHSALRLSGSRGSNSVHLSLRTGCDSSDRTSCVFLFPPLSRPSPSASSRLCLARDRRRCLRSVTGRSLFISLSHPISDPRRWCMCGPRRLPDGSGISEFPRTC